MQQIVQGTISLPAHILPPISCACKLDLDRDQKFVNSLRHNVTLEMETYDTDEMSHKQKYVVLKDAFSQLIEYISGYSLLLTAIEGEFEDCIQTIERGKQEAFFLSGKIKAMVAEQTSLSNYMKRSGQLKEMCSCEGCSIMPIVRESVCCKDIDQVVRKMDEFVLDLDCITEHPGFRTVCLDRSPISPAVWGWKTRCN